MGGGGLVATGTAVAALLRTRTSYPATCHVELLVCVRSQVLVGVYGLLALALMGAFGSLLGFHAFLMYLGIGTYDWLIRGFQPGAAAATDNRENQSL